MSGAIAITHRPTPAATILLIALLTAGEGWHNNHHADSRSARHGHEWWEIDVTWLMIRCLMLLGLAWDVAVPSPNLKAKFNSASPQVDRRLLKRSSPDTRRRYFISRCTALATAV